MTKIGILKLIIGKKNTRHYLSSNQKKELFLKQGFTCQICGKNDRPGQRGIQADHKIPLLRGGSNDSENWQTLCNECNVAKRRSCQNCSIDCKTCFWAFPNNTTLPITLFFSKKQQ